MRAVTAYGKTICKAQSMNDKVFDISKYDFTQISQSFGLAVTASINFN